MSLDIYLHGADCEHCGRGGETLYDANITHNLTPMWRKAGVYDALYMSKGHKAAEYIEVLERGVADFQANYDEYRKLDSPNGWGLAKHALPFLEQTAAAFKANPTAIVHVSK